MIQRALLALQKAGIDEVLIVTGYRGEEVKKAIGDAFAGMKVDYIYNPGWGKGNLYSLLVAQQELNEPFLLCMSDHLFDPRIASGLLSRGPTRAVVLAVDFRKEPTPEDTKVLVQEERIVDVGKGIQDSNGVDVGLMLCTPEIFQHAKQAADQGFVELADCIRIAAQHGAAYAFDLDRIPSYLPAMRKRARPYWKDVDTPSDLKQAEQMIVAQAGKEPSDLVAKYLNKPIEDRLVLLLAGTRLTANQMTIIVNTLAYMVTHYS